MILQYCPSMFVLVTGDVASGTAGVGTEYGRQRRRQHRQTARGRWSPTTTWNQLRVCGGASDWRNGSI